MEAKEYTIYNKTRESPVTAGVTIVNSTREPLTALRVMVEGLGEESESGLWLTHITGFPMVPRLTPFDLVYLDKYHRVVERAELLPASEMPRFKNPALSALILPFQTISTSKIDTGDELDISEDRESEVIPEPVTDAASGTELVAASEPETVASLASVAPHTEIESTASLLDSNLTSNEAGIAAPILSAEVEPIAGESSNVVSSSRADTTEATTPASENAVAAPKAESWKNQTPAATLFRSRSKRKKRKRGKAHAAVNAAQGMAVSHAGAVAQKAAARTSAQDPVASGLQSVADNDVRLAAEVPSTPLESSLPRIVEAVIPEEPVFEPANHPSDRNDPASVADAAAPVLAENAPVRAPEATADPAQEAAPALAEAAAVVLADKELPVPVATAALTVPPSGVSAAALAAPAERPILVDPAARPIVKVGKPNAKIEKHGAKADKPDASSEESEGLVDRFLRWLYPNYNRQDRRKSLRQPSPGLVAYERSDGSPRMHEIADISSTGLFLRTEEPWEPGAVIALTLQRSGPPEDHSEQRIELQAGAVRIGKDGVGLSFLWPTEMDLHLWETPVRADVFEAVPDYILREIRIARALAFLKRVCPPASEEAGILFYNQLSNIRVANAVEIALKAERLLINEPNAAGLLAHPDLIIRILEDGSWVDVDWIQQLWAGLLATSCTEEGQDESNLVFINLLSLFAPIHARILSAACAKATQVMSGKGASSPYLLACSAEEMARMTGASNLTKIYRSIAELSELGLLEKSARPSTYSVSGATRTKPTDLGLQMYARCNGKREVTTAA
jgi:hypothetical protein